MSQVLIELKDALFRQLSAVKNSPTVFSKPVSLSIRADERWAIVGPGKTKLLKALSSQYIADPPLSRQYPVLNKETWPSDAVQFLEFKGALPTAHLAARYEFFKDEFDETTRKFIIGNVNNHRKINYDLVAEAFKKFRLEGLEDRWALGLSNGQTRRARLARALVREPTILVIDDPFLGLDPTATQTVSDVLESVPPRPHVILGLRFQDELPKWITHIAITNEEGIINSGKKEELSDELEKLRMENHDWHLKQLESQAESIATMKKLFSHKDVDKSVPLLDLQKVTVSYKGQEVLKDLEWKIHYGERWHLRGDNGTGKSTLLSLITADHPQSWNSRVVMNGKPRRAGVQSYFDINENIGFTSPELHSIYPGDHTVFQAITTGFQVGNMIPPKNLTEEQLDRVNTYLREFVLEDKRDTCFSELSISDQKLVLFIRALIKNPDLVILDEALSVMDDSVVEQCKELLRYYPGTVIAIGHLQDEVPDTDRYIRLKGPGDYEIGSC